MADLANILVKHSEFSFKGVKVKNIAIYSTSAEKLARDFIVASIPDISFATSLVANIDKNLCKL